MYAQHDIESITKMGRQRKYPSDFTEQSRQRYTQSSRPATRPTPESTIAPRVLSDIAPLVVEADGVLELDVSVGEDAPEEPDMLAVAFAAAVLPMAAAWNAEKGLSAGAFTAKTIPIWQWLARARQTAGVCGIRGATYLA